MISAVLNVSLSHNIQGGCYWDCYFTENTSCREEYQCANVSLTQTKIIRYLEPIFWQNNSEIRHANEKKNNTEAALPDICDSQTIFSVKREV